MPEPTDESFMQYSLKTASFHSVLSGLLTRSMTLMPCDCGNCLSSRGV